MLLPGAEDMDLRGPLADFAARGYAHLGPVITEDALAALRARADELMLGRLTYPGLFFQRDTTTGRYDDLEYGKGWQGPTLNYRKIEKWAELFDQLALRLANQDVIKPFFPFYYTKAVFVLDLD